MRRSRYVFQLRSGTPRSQDEPTEKGKSWKKKRHENLWEMLEGAKSIGAGAATIASAGAAVGIGNVFSSLIHSVARNPSLAKQLFGYAILGFALTEAIALFALMMAFLISFVFRLLPRRLWLILNGLCSESGLIGLSDCWSRSISGVFLSFLIDRQRSHKQFKPKYPPFWHINEGIEEIMADHVHQEMTRNLMKVFLRLFFLIVMKDVFSFLVSRFWRT